MGIKVPDDLAIVSFDQMDASDLFYAPLTYLKQPIQEMGEIATKMLLENIEKEKETEKINLEATLVIRNSTLPLMSKSRLQLVVIMAASYHYSFHKEYI